MMLALIGTVTLLAAWVVEYWRAVEERKLRWQFFALRDELRAAAIDDPKLLDSEAFRHLDESLSVFSHYAPSEFSLWQAIPIRMLRANGPQKKTAGGEAIAKCESQVPKHIVLKGGRLIMRCLMLRHVLLLTLVSLTGVGLVGLIWCYQWALARVNGLLVGANRADRSDGLVHA